MSNLSGQSPPLGTHSSQSISISGRLFLADSSGALFWPARSTLIVADMALGLLPVDGGAGADQRVFSQAKQKLVQLAGIIDHYDADNVMVLDGSIRSDNAKTSLDQETLDILYIMQEDRDWLWINGPEGEEQHSSSAVSNSQTDWGGYILPQITIGGIHFRYQPRPLRSPHEIAAALKPAARVSTWGHIVRRPCFIGNNNRLLLPAFGTSSGGRNVLDQPFHQLFSNDGLKIWMLSDGPPNPVASRKLCLD